jgi:hypothetical protein
MQCFQLARANVKPSFHDISEGSRISIVCKKQTEEKTLDGQRMKPFTIHENDLLYQNFSTVKRRLHHQSNDNIDRALNL